MTPDVNVLVAAYRADHAHHDAAYSWLAEARRNCAQGSDTFTLLPMVANATFYSGMRLTWSETWKFSKITTTDRVRMRLSTVTRPLKSAVTESHNLLGCTITHGKIFTG
jgi:predicted nucleic acid-binding protein